jgi:hypothetical protein
MCRSGHCIVNNLSTGLKSLTFLMDTRVVIDCISNIHDIGERYTKDRRQQKKVRVRNSEADI